MKRKAGRPPLPAAEPIPDTPGNVAKAILQGPPKRKWRYERLRQAESVDQTASEEADDSHLSDEEYFAQFDTTTVRKDVADRIKRNGTKGLYRIM
ncbi:MAG: hypothetical protein OXE48_10100 [Gammaproteobacteria bacterium]|nr:hypothetical protein [Gammaproteobacteria bacterium]